MGFVLKDEHSLLSFAECLLPCVLEGGLCWLVFDNLAKVVTWEEEIPADDLSPSD